MSNSVVVAESPQGLQVVTRQDMEALQAQRQLLKEFISSQLKEAQFTDSYASDYGDGDYGVIPGTKKKVLLKPGSEKILQLFNLGARFRLVDKNIDKDTNFALYEYECEIYSRKTGNAIATCIGTANSQEVKYKERTVWKTEKVKGKDVKTSKKEPTPIFDVLNTLSKMAQKRALVGATILATAASDYFTQDMEPEEKAEDQSVPSDAKDVTPTPPAKAEDPPTCCGRRMMVSKFPNRETGESEWFCLQCKSKLPMGAA